MSRLEVLKTYKIYIGGKFPRTESGRFFQLTGAKEKLLANMCQCSRKDLREAVVAARAAFGAWSGRAAFNRGQILYRIAEMLEGRRAQFVEELMLQGATKTKAEAEVNLAVDRLVYYSGWCDKYQQIFSAVNPVATTHFNFSVPEPTGVVGIVCDDESSLIGLVSMTAAAIAGENTVVVLASEKKPLCAITFAEVLNSSDVPGGVVNVLTGFRKELLEQFGTHMDINAVVYSGNDAKEISDLRQYSATNLKRICVYAASWNEEQNQNPYFISDLQEIKTTWHPIENIGGSGSGY